MTRGIKKARGRKPRSPPPPPPPLVEVERGRVYFPFGTSTSSQADAAAAEPASSKDEEPIIGGAVVHPGRRALILEWFMDMVRNPERCAEIRMGVGPKERLHGKTMLVCLVNTLAIFAESLTRMGNYNAFVEELPATLSTDGPCLKPGKIIVVLHFLMGSMFSNTCIMITLEETLRGARLGRFMGEGFSEVKISRVTSRKELELPGRMTQASLVGLLSSNIHAQPYNGPCEAWGVRIGEKYRHSFNEFWTGYQLDSNAQPIDTGIHKMISVLRYMVADDALCRNVQAMVQTGRSANPSSDFYSTKGAIGPLIPESSHGSVARTWLNRLEVTPALWQDVVNALEWDCEGGNEPIHPSELLGGRLLLPPPIGGPTRGNTHQPQRLKPPQPA